LAWLWVYGTFPAADLDHINRDRACCRIANLREATPKQNTVNSKVRQGSRSGLKGGYQHGRRWQAAIDKNGKTVHLETFNTVEAAHEAY
jgi:hypothetical protein